MKKLMFGPMSLLLSRPSWDPAGATVVASDTEAAEVIANKGYSRVFLTTGRSGVAAFSGSDAWFLIRVVTAPDVGALPRDHELLLSRGPYGYDDERELLRLDAKLRHGSWSAACGCLNWP
jgi:precorrin-6A/cobalt-precorrin-6A reductase